MIILAYAAFVAFVGVVSSVSLPEYHPLLEASQFIYPAGNSTSDLTKRQGVCPSNYVSCGIDTCSPIGWNCCADGSFCAPDKYCDGVGCCPNGRICSGPPVGSDTPPPPNSGPTSAPPTPSPTPSPTVDKPTPTFQAPTIDFTSRLSSFLSSAPIATFLSSNGFDGTKTSTSSSTPAGTAASAVSSPTGGSRSGARSTSLHDCGMKLYAIATVVVLTVFTH